MAENKQSNELKEIVGLLRTGCIEQAIARVPEIIKVIKDLSANRPEEDMKHIALCTRSTLNSFQNRDFVFMADILEYELLPLIKDKA